MFFRQRTYATLEDDEAGDAQSLLQQGADSECTASKALHVKARPGHKRQKSGEQGVMANEAVKGAASTHGAADITHGNPGGAAQKTDGADGRPPVVTKGSAAAQKEDRADAQVGRESSKFTVTVTLPASTEPFGIKLQSIEETQTRDGSCPFREGGAKPSSLLARAPPMASAPPRVVTVPEDSPAHGKLLAGDAVLSVNDVEPSSACHACSMIASARESGMTVHMRVERKRT